MGLASRKGSPMKGGVDGKLETMAGRSSGQPSASLKDAPLLLGTKDTLDDPVENQKVFNAEFWRSDQNL